MRRAIDDVFDEAISEDDNKESLRVTLNKLLPFMKVWQIKDNFCFNNFFFKIHDKPDVNVDTLDALLEILMDQDNVQLELMQKFTFMETR